MKKILLITFLFISFGCQNSSDKEIDVFFERLSVLTIKKNTINLNIQNVHTTRTADGGPFIPKEAIGCKNGSCKVAPLKCKGVGCPPDGVMKDHFILKYEPKHPDANKNGYVSYPDLSVQEEMTKLIRVQRDIEYLMTTMPVEKNYFYSDDIQKYLKKYPGLNHSYNFEKLLRE
jgi:flagellar basal-body rod protein FlgC